MTTTTTPKRPKKSKLSTDFEVGQHVQIDRPEGYLGRHLSFGEKGTIKNISVLKGKDEIEFRDSAPSSEIERVLVQLTRERESFSEVWLKPRNLTLV